MSVSGLFAARDSVLAAVRELQREGFDKLELLSPVPDRELIAAVRPKRSLVGLFTLAGGIFGMLLGFFGASLAHLHWSGVVVGGKPVVSVPPFVVVAFEMTILFGGLATMAGVILLVRLPRWKMDSRYDARVSEDHYLLLVETDHTASGQAGDILKSHGAEVGR